MLSRTGEIVRRADPDRFFCALFAPAERRDALFTLYAFNRELARAREATREPMMALVRLQWWREVVEGAARQHEVATPLRALLDAGALAPADLLPIIDGREAETEEIATVATWREYLRATAGGLAVAAGRLLGATGDLAGLRQLGAAYGAAGVLRSTQALARQGRTLLPSDVLTEVGLTSEQAAAAEPDTARLGGVFRRLGEEGRAMLTEGRRDMPPRKAVAAALPAVLARRDLRHPGAVRPRGLGDRMAVLAAAMRGRV